MLKFRPAPPLLNWIPDGRSALLAGHGNTPTSPHAQAVTVTPVKERLLAAPAIDTPYPPEILLATRLVNVPPRVVLKSKPDFLMLSTLTFVTTRFVQLAGMVDGPVLMPYADPVEPVRFGDVSVKSRSVTAFPNKSIPCSLEAIGAVDISKTVLFIPAPTSETPSRMIFSESG